MILCVEDDPVVRDHLQTIVSSRYQAPRTVGDLRGARAALAERVPEICVVDLGLPDGDGVDFVREVVGAGAKALVLSSASEEERILAALRAGACGYLFKEDLHQRLLSGIEEVRAGGVPLSVGAGTVVLRHLRGATPPRHLPALTGREQGVLELLADGCSYDEIAQSLKISLNTVRTHVRGLYEKLGSVNKTEAVMLALHLGLLQRR